MLEKYYVITMDRSEKERWVLGDIIENADWKLLSPKHIDLKIPHYTVKLVSDGEILDYSETVRGVPIVSERLKSCLETSDLLVNNVEFRPVKIYGKKTPKMYVLLILEEEDVIDYQRSDYISYDKSELISRVDLGDIRMIFDLVVDAKKIGSRHFLRLENRKKALIVSQLVKEKFELANLRGPLFLSVNGDCKTLV